MDKRYNKLERKAPRLAMSLLVRDEADIVAENILYHAAQGVSYFVVTDNGSVDGTRATLERLKSRVNLHIIDEPNKTIDQDIWVTRMALWLTQHTDADWVINNDADEFWVTEEGTLIDAVSRDLQEAEKSDVGVLYCSRFNYLPVIEDLTSGSYRFYMNRVKVINDLGSSRGANKDNVLITLQGEKVMSRLDGLRSVGMGNHGAVHDACSVKSKNITIAHYPLRDYRQFESKVVNHGTSISNNSRFGPQINWHLRNWYECYKSGVLRAEYNKYVIDSDLLCSLLSDGVIIEDTRLCNRLAKYDQFKVTEAEHEWKTSEV